MSFNGSRRRRLALVGASGLAAGCVLLRIALHEFPALGPLLADGVRSVVGPAPVAWAEDAVYGAEDFINVRTQEDAKPKEFWATKASNQAAQATGRPEDVVPPFDKVALPSDGVWQPFGPTGALWRTLIHPDPRRTFAAVAIVAFSIDGREIHIVPGIDEPKSSILPASARTGLIPEIHHDDVLAVWNGGFKAMHGNYGMRVGEQQLIPPRDIACTIAWDPQEGLQVRTFSALKGSEAHLAWYRQTPPCLVERGLPNPGLLSEYNKNWGATVGGDTVIRRSAMGVSKDGRFVFYALGDATTAQSIGKAMEAVGCHDAAQLDVNFSFPRFFAVDHGASGPTLVEPVIPDLKYSPAEYLRVGNPRDFFYLKKSKKKLPGT